MDKIELQTISAYIARNCATVVTVAKDKLGEIPVHKTPLIVNCNTGNSNTKGEHWVWFFIRYINGELVADYMDSYGKDATFYGISFPFQIINSNNRQIQAFDSDKCGHYCLAFTHYRICQFPFKKICSLFSLDHQANDQKVTRLYEKLSSRSLESRNIRTYCPIQKCQSLKSVLKLYHDDTVSAHQYLL